MEGRDVAAADPVEFSLDAPFQILRPQVAAIDQDQILGPPGRHDLAIDDQAQVAGLQPAVAGQDVGGRVGIAEIAPHQAGPLDEDAPDVAVRDGSTVGIADLDPVPGQGRAATDETARSLIDSPADDVAIAFEVQQIERLDLQAAAQRSHCHGQGGLGHAIAGDIGPGIEPRPAEPLGELGQRADPDHVAADARDPPAGQFERRGRARLGPSGAELIAEGRAVGDGAAVARYQVQPQQGPPHEGAGRQQIDRHLATQRGQQEADQPHVMIERQPGHGAVLGHDLKPVAGDGHRVGHQGTVGDHHPGREPRAAGRELDISEVVGADVGQGHIHGLRQFVQQRPDRDAARLIRRLAQPFGVGGGPEHGRGLGRAQHPGDLLDIDRAAAQGRGQGQGGGHQTGILAGKEGADEVGVGLCGQPHPVAGVQAAGQQTTCQDQGLGPQFGIGHRPQAFPPPAIQGDARLSHRREIQRLGQGREIGMVDEAVRRGWSGGGQACAF